MLLFERQDCTGFPADMVTLLKWVAGHKYESADVRLSNETLLCFP